MSYHVWSTDGFGFCVSDIETTPAKLLELASLRPEVLSDVRAYLADYFNGEEYKDEDLTMEAFDEVEGAYGEYGVAAVLYQVIWQDFDATVVSNFNGDWYILYTPKYPWTLSALDKELTKERLIEIYNEYIRVLTDKPVEITFCTVENGG